MRVSQTFLVNVLAIYLLALPLFLSYHAIEHHMHDDHMHEEHDSGTEVEHDCDLYEFYTTAKNANEAQFTDSFQSCSDIIQTAIYKPVHLEVVESFNLRAPPVA